jgi:hypothetical protein
MPPKPRNDLQKGFEAARLDLGSSDDLKAHRLDKNEAKKLVAMILRSGDTSFTQHSREELQNDGLDAGDAMNTLRCGKIVRQPELILGAYRYVVETGRMAVAVEIHSRTSQKVITAWRK